MPRVSIITTTYKHEKFIAQTIESVLSQTFTDWELLIGDDSPDDATWNIIQNYTEKYPEKIKAWHHSPNKGIVDNMNFLLEKVSLESEYVAFLEGDDMYTPDNLEKKLEIFWKYREVQLVYSDMSYIDTQGKVLVEGYLNHRGCPFYQNARVSGDEYFRQVAGPIVSWSTGMVRKWIFQTIQINEVFPMDAGDCDFYFNISVRFPIYGIRTPLTLYRRHSNNVSRVGRETLRSQRDANILYMRDRTAEYIRQGFIGVKVARQKTAYIYISFAIFSLEHGLKKDAWDNLRLAFREDFWYGFHYKIAIGIFLCIPSRVGKYILKKIIKRSDN